MINLRVAWVMAHEIQGTKWETECLALGLDPSVATADDVLGRMSLRMTHGGGKPVLPLDDDRISDLASGMEAPEIVEAEDPKAFVAEVTSIAGLTKTEKRVVYAIVDGSPIPDGKQYTGPLARRLNMTAAAVQKAWSRAKDKLRQNWVAE